MWIDEFIRLLFPINPAELRIEEANQLKQTHIPNALYRYRSFDENEHTLEYLINQQERLSYPSEFNDPFDTAMQINYDLVNRELFLHRTLPNVLEELQKRGVSFSEKEIEEIRNSKDPSFSFFHHMAGFNENLDGDKKEESARALSKITSEKNKLSFDQFQHILQTGYLVMCLSEVKDSILMWSHYVQNHTGFCIEYNYQELGPRPQSSILCPALYTEELFDSTQFILQLFNSNDHSFNNLSGIYTAMTKSKEWAYEKEWRVIFPFGPNAPKEKRFIRVPLPKALYVGAKANLENIEKIKNIAITKKVPVYQMKTSENSHELFQTMLYHPNQQ